MHIILFIRKNKKQKRDNHALKMLTIVDENYSHLEKSSLAIIGSNFGVNIVITTDDKSPTVLLGLERPIPNLVAAHIQS